MFWRSHWKSVLWAVVILILSTISGDSVSRIGFIKFHHADKLVHCFMYFVFAILLISGGNRLKGQGGVTTVSMVWAAVISILYGVCMELIQHCFSSRTASMGDVMANMVGVALASLMYKWINKISKGYL